jgi:hypothetical protein
MSVNHNIERRFQVIALDLEGTLISNAMSCFPRPGLSAFLDFCHTHFQRVVLFTAVAERRGRPILDVLIGEGSAPGWVRQIGFVSWSGDHKDLRFISGVEVDNVLLVDDLESYVHPDQLAWWVPIAPFVAPYRDTDRELLRVTEELRRRLGLSAANTGY